MIGRDKMPVCDFYFGADSVTFALHDQQGFFEFKIFNQQERLFDQQKWSYFANFYQQDRRSTVIISHLIVYSLSTIVCGWSSKIGRNQKSRKPLKTKAFGFFLAPTGGFEPLTCRLGGGRSILLSYVGVLSGVRRRPPSAFLYFTQ